MYRANSEGQADTDKMEDPRQSNVAHKRNIGESGSDNEEKTQIGPNEVDDVHMRRVEALSHQTGGEMELAVGPLQDGDGKVDMISEVESSGDKRINLDGTHLGIKQANAKKTKEDDASLNLGEERDSCRVQLVEEKKTDKNKQKDVPKKMRFLIWLFCSSKTTDDAAEQQDEKVTRTQRLHYGLENQGATCYLNSVLQVLSMTTEMHDRLNPRTKPDLQLRKIFEGLKEATRGTKTITAAFGIQNVWEQRDAAECLEMILCKISPQASEVFQGELTHKKKCSKGHKINVETNPFWTLPLSLKDTHDSSYSVKRGFESIFKSKSFSGRNMVYCNHCNKKTEAESGYEMVGFPQILTLRIKRFALDYNTMTYFKSDCSVDVPRALQRENKKYELYAMVNHHGSLTGGHYTATILSNEDNTWYEFDDTHIYKVKEQPFAENNPYNSRTVYLLMYRDTAPAASAAPAAQERGLLSIFYRLLNFSSKTRVTDDAAEQADEKATECQKPDEKRARERREADDQEKTKTRQTEENEENEGPSVRCATRPVQKIGQERRRRKKKNGHR